MIDNENLAAAEPLSQRLREAVAAAPGAAGV
jgi:hypothetical protein